MSVIELDLETKGHQSDYLHKISNWSSLSNIHGTIMLIFEEEKTTCASLCVMNCLWASHGVSNKGALILEKFADPNEPKIPGRTEHVGRGGHWYFQSGIDRGCPGSRSSPSSPVNAKRQVTIASGHNKCTQNKKIFKGEDGQGEWQTKALSVNHVNTPKTALSFKWLAARPKYRSSCVWYIHTLLSRTEKMSWKIVRDTGSRSPSDL